MVDSIAPYMPVNPQKTDWETPHDLFEKLWDEFGGFDLDPCCSPGHYTECRIVAEGGYSFYETGLTAKWFGKVYMNPPYGRAISQWIEKAVSEVEKKNAELVVALLPARVDVKWWHKYVGLNHVWTPRFDDGHPSIVDGEKTAFTGTMRADAVRFLAGRLKFVGAKASAPFPSAIVVWKR